MKNNTKIYVSKKAAEIVESIDTQKVALVSKTGTKTVYSCTFIDGSRIDNPNYLEMQKRIAHVNKVNREGIIAAAEKQQAEKAERKRLEAEAAAAKTKPLTQGDIDEACEIERKRELKRKRDARYRANNREAIRERDREYRKKKAAARAAAKGAK